MKVRSRNLISFAGCVIAFWAFNAQARLEMPEKEHVQSIVWIVEGATFITAIAIALLVWKVSQRSRKTRARNKTEDEGK